MRFLIDMDGVLVDFVTTFFDTTVGVEERKRLFANWSPGLYNLHEVAPQIPKTIWNTLTATFWSGLKPTFDMYPFLKEFIKTLDPAKDSIELFTTVTNKRAMEGKKLWAEAYCPGTPIIFTDIGGGKSHEATNDTLLIDDYDKHIREFRLAGGQGILVPRPWNFLHDVVDSVEWVRLRLKERGYDFEVTETEHE